MGQNECATVIPAARNAVGKSADEIIDALAAAGRTFDENVRAKFQKAGEW